MALNNPRLSFHEKCNRSGEDVQPTEFLNGERFLGEFVGPNVLVKDPQMAKRLFIVKNYGHFLGNRMKFVNSNCFPIETSEINEEQDVNNQPKCVKDDLMEKEEISQEKLNSLNLPESHGIVIEDDPRKQWLEIINRNSNSNLFLSNVESLYLFHELKLLSIHGIENSAILYQKFYSIYGLDFVKEYAVYRHLRSLGWVVRDSLFFGAKFSLYKDSVETYHSSGVVRIVDDSEGLDALRMSAIMRELANCKKILILAYVNIPENLDLNKIDSIDFIKVNVFKIECQVDKNEHFQHILLVAFNQGTKAAKTKFVHHIDIEAFSSPVTMW